ncbi:IS4 family transposase [Streptomyces mirabilis]|uniref:IS4 family transposase n=1 Tax=Streptomyces mirabilis TaxID=68239 RepID=UPI0021C20BAB|nr:IS4 family transposase [Streptomyces mirabilis]MCT9113458.1 IS4 family transposase [Streptomyces mirabilis]
MPKCATVDATRTVTVASDVYAPGHLGELTQVLPFELVDSVLEETRATQRRLRLLPSRTGVYFVLALGLFERVGARLVWEKMVAGLGGLPVVSPSEKALRDLRRRIGVAPLRALFEVLAGPLAQPRTPGVRYRKWRTVAFDGCSSLRVPDEDRNRSWLGKTRARFGLAGYPALMLMTLVETGTRGLLGAAFGPSSTGENAYALRLVHLLKPDMLVLTDRGFDSGDFLEAAVATGAQLLARGKSTRRPPVLATLPDGSYLTQIYRLKLRVIEAKVTVTGADGTVVSDHYRLVTTLTDPQTDPAEALISLYHERWEIESAYFALRHTLLRGRVLRSKDPVGIEQEMWALLVLYQAIRTVMVTAVETRQGTDPDRASFTVALEAVRDSVTTATGVLPPTTGPVDLVGHIGGAVLAGLLPHRRARFSARTVKSGISRYHTWNGEGRSRTSTNITAIVAKIHQPGSPRTTPTGPEDTGFPAPAPGRSTAVMAIMHSAPERAWRAADIGRPLGITNEKALNSFRVQLAKWARQGLLTKTAPATYRLASPTPLTPAP